MSVLAALQKWWSERQRKPLSEHLAVVCSDEGVAVQVLSGMEQEWNQSCRWMDIKRVCFKDQGIYQSDLIYLEVANQERPVIVPTEARGGDEFFGQLEERGLFPREIWAKAIAETGGATHCWPENDRAS